MVTSYTAVMLLQARARRAQIALSPPSSLLPFPLLLSLVSRLQRLQKGISANPNHDQAQKGPFGWAFQNPNQVHGLLPWLGTFAPICEKKKNLYALPVVDPVVPVPVVDPRKGLRN